MSICDGNREDMEQRFHQLQGRLTSVKTENEEVWKTLETAERSLMDMINTQDYDCSLLFSDEDRNRIEEKLPETAILKKRADQQETEDFYLKVLDNQFFIICPFIRWGGGWKFQNSQIFILESLHLQFLYRKLGRCIASGPLSHITGVYACPDTEENWR